MLLHIIIFTLKYQKLSKDPSVNEEDEAKLAAALIAQNSSHNRGWYRVNAIRNLTGGNKLVPHVNTYQQEVSSVCEGVMCVKV